MPNLSGTDWQAYSNNTQPGKSQTPAMFKSMTNSLGQTSGNQPFNPTGQGSQPNPGTGLSGGGSQPNPGTGFPGGTTATVPGSGGNLGVTSNGTLTASAPTGLTGHQGNPGTFGASNVTTGSGLTSPTGPAGTAWESSLAGGTTPPAGGSFTVPGLGLVPGLDDFRAFMSYSNPTQQAIKQLMENAGIFDQFAPYLQRDAAASPWALSALGAYGPTGTTIPLGGGTGTPFDGYDPAKMMTLLQQHGIASNYTDPTVQTQPTQVPTSAPPPTDNRTQSQIYTDRLQSNAAQMTALNAATGGVAGGSAQQRLYDEPIRQNLGGQAAFNQTGGLIAGGQFTDPFAASGFQSPYAMAGYVAPGQNGGPHNVYGPGGTFIGYQFPDGSVIGANGQTITGPSATEGGGQPATGYGSPGTTISNNNEIATINGSGNAPVIDPATGRPFESGGGPARAGYGSPGTNGSLPYDGPPPTATGYGSPGTVTSPNGEISTIPGTGGPGQFPSNTTPSPNGEIATVPGSAVNPAPMNPADLGMVAQMALTRLGM